MADSQFEETVGGRIASLETNQVRFHEDLQRLTRSFSDFDARMDQKLDTLTSKLSDNQRTPWGNILTAAGVMLMLIIAVGSMNNSFVMSTIKNNSSNIMEMDTTLQREMRLLDHDLETQIGSNLTLIDMLQDEVDRLRNLQNPVPHVHIK